MEFEKELLDELPSRCNVVTAVMNHRVVNTLRFLWVVVTLWYEVGVFFRSVSSCNWPDAVLQSVCVSAG